ncbi:MAG: putative sporulation protein YtxC, partial [Clostridia bacterium]|nr:putative sporulation protein YtxC [Clostridia bacterium]
TEECKAEFISEQDYNVEKIDDFILNSLIVISPKRIVIHNGMTDLTHELKMTITGVFADKVKYCSGCCKCQKGK